MRHRVAVVEATSLQGPSTMQITTIGLDLAKSVFQVHCVQADGGVVRRKLRRAQVLPFFEAQPPSVVGMEACATAHHWAREIAARGHEVRLIVNRRRSLTPDRRSILTRLAPGFAVERRRSA
jgi:transposase